jgi:hypothetical protein
MKDAALRLTADQVEIALWAVRDLRTRRETPPTPKDKAP